MNKNINNKRDMETIRYFQKVYLWMCLGLLISGLTAYFVAFNDSLRAAVLGSSGIVLLLILLQLGLVIALAWAIKKIPAKIAVFLFFLYCLFTGMTLSVIFLTYTTESIFVTFFIAAGMFGAMAFYGYVTKTDLTGMGVVLFMALIGIILASVVNMFLQSSGLSYIVSFLGVIIFAGLTAYDMQKLKKFNVLGNEGTDEDLKESIIGALTLYLDFINLFLSLLRLFGRARD